MICDSSKLVPLAFYRGRIRRSSIQYQHFSQHDVNRSILQKKEAAVKINGRDASNS